MTNKKIVYDLTIGAGTMAYLKERFNEVQERKEREVIRQKGAVEAARNQLATEERRLEGLLREQRFLYSKSAWVAVSAETGTEVRPPHGKSWFAHTVSDYTGKGVARLVVTEEDDPS